MGNNNSAGASSCPTQTEQIMTTNRILLCLLLCSAPALVACGGGSSTNETMAPATTQPAEPDSTPPAPAETKEAPAHAEPKEVPAPAETKEAPAPAETDSTPLTPTEPEEVPAPSEPQEAPAPSETEEVPALPKEVAPFHINTRTDSGMTSMGNILGFDYEIRNEEELKSVVNYETEDFGSYEQRPISASYTNPQGFRGIARNSSFYEPVTADVKLSVTFAEDGTQSIDELTIGQNTGLDLAGRDYGYIKFSSVSVGDEGRFDGDGAMTGAPQNTPSVHLSGRFGNDFANVVGSVDMKHTYTGGTTSLVGVFAAEQD